MPAGPEGIIVNQVDRRARGQDGYTEQQIAAGGLRITTTVDKGYQDAAVAAVDDVMDGRERATLREALVVDRPEDRRRASPTTAGRRRRVRLRPGASGSRARR